MRVGQGGLGLGWGEENMEVRAEQFTTPLHGLLYDITLISSSGTLESRRMREREG